MSHTVFYQTVIPLTNNILNNDVAFTITLFRFKLHEIVLNVEKELYKVLFSAPCKDPSFLTITFFSLYSIIYYAIQRLRNPFYKKLF